MTKAQHTTTAPRTRLGKAWNKFAQRLIEQRTPNSEMERQQIAFEHGWTEAEAYYSNERSELLEAGKELLEMIEAYDLEGELDAGEDGKGPVATLRAAIAKATGQAA